MEANNTKPRSQLYKSTDGKSFIASDDTDIGEHRYKSYIKITFNAEYEGNLIKTQP